MEDEDGFTIVVSKKTKKEHKKQELWTKRKEKEAKEVVAKKAKSQPFPFLKCPRGIVPFLPDDYRRNLYLVFHRGRSRKLWQVRSQFRQYQWDDSRQLLSFNREAFEVEISWTTKATEEELATIKEGNWVQPNNNAYQHALRSRQVLRWANRRSEDHYDILHKQLCKVYSEALEILYGENRYVFNTAGAYQTSTYPARLTHPDDPILPGPMYYGESMTAEASDHFVDMAFWQRGAGQWIPTFIFRNPLFAFARTIGRQNFSLIKNIKLEGGLKTINLDAWWSNDGNVSFPRALPYYTTFLNAACHNIQKLTLNVRYVPDRASFEIVGGYWDLDLENEYERTDNERIGRMICNVVTTLPNLRELKLGEYDLDTNQDTGKQNYEAPHRKDKEKTKLAREGASEEATEVIIKDGEQGPDEWEGALHWLGLVKKRERARLRELPIGASLE
ncbi:hypothetical protein EG329_002596 [Mollisiaceae sp. DMI_Dod_QoI]|nr:hypothetical protein EG329_002596 [Helotiales sp. DMI_Dod_QoI]